MQGESRGFALIERFWGGLVRVLGRQSEWDWKRAVSCDTFRQGLDTNDESSGLITNDKGSGNLISLIRNIQVLSDCR